MLAVSDVNTWAIFFFFFFVFAFFFFFFWARRMSGKKAFISRSREQIIHLDGVSDGAGQQEEGGGVLEALASHQREGVLERRAAPPVLVEVVLEESRHPRVIH